MNTRDSFSSNRSARRVEGWLRLKPSALLRIASIVSFLYFVGHTSGMPWTPSQGPETTSLIGTMKSYQFEVLGAARTYWDFYFGFGLIISVFVLLQSVVLWVLGTMARYEAADLRPLIAAFALANVIEAGLVGRFFFVAPMSMQIAIVICLGLAFRASRPTVATG